MRQILHCRGIRSVCYLIILALVSSVAPSPFVSSASAQLMPTYSVGVVDFTNESGVQGEMLARMATDAVVVEMSKTNRYDVSITRSMLNAEMEKLDIVYPLDRIELVRLGEALSADAMLEGTIRSVSLAGSGAGRRASVMLVVQMVDQASGEIINGAVQTGTSSARVGYAPDDDALITEAINNAAFLAVKTMVDYIVPEATVQMNIGSDQVMLNKGARDGLKPGMRMIVLRQKEIIGYVQIRDVSATDSHAKVTKSMRGIQPEDKVRAIYEMPTVSGSAKSEPLPSGAPTGGTGSKNTLGKMGKFLITIAVVAGIASLFSSGRGNESAGTISAYSSKGIPVIRWDAGDFDHGKHVVELQIVRDSDFDNPVKVVRSPAAWDKGWTPLSGLYGTGADVNVLYKRLDTNPADTFTETQVAIPVEPFGTQHEYEILVLYKTNVAGGSEDDAGGVEYSYSKLSNTVRATAIEPVRYADVIMPAYDPNDAPPEVLLTDLQQGKVNLQWQRKTGADSYRVWVWPASGNTSLRRSWDVVETGPTVQLSADQRLDLANWLGSAFSSGSTINWRVDCWNSTDDASVRSTPAQGDVNRFVIGIMPPPVP